MTSQLNRRSILAIAVTICALFDSPPILAANRGKVTVTTHTYKLAGKLEIKADVHRLDDDVQRPVLVWIHGGALINGHRASINGRVKKRMIDAGYVIVSIDYRLAPETKLPAIVEDVEDAFKWIREHGQDRFNADTRRIAVMGSSAGGCLTLTAGFRVKPRPTVLVAFWGYGDLIGDWYSKPSAHARHNRTRITEEEAHAQVNGLPLSDSRDRKGNGGLFYNFCRQRGTWPKEVTGWSPDAEPEKFYPYMAVRNVTAEFPPTMLIHGRNDTDVPYEQSMMMATELEKHSVEHKLLSIPNGEHGLGGGDPQLVDQAYQAAFEFVDLYMRP